MFLESKKSGEAPSVPVLEPTLRGLITWLESQDGVTKYEAGSPTDCLLCQFVSAISGTKKEWPDAVEMLDIYGPGNRDVQFGRVAYGHIWDGGNTYAGALIRARALLSAASHSEGER